MPREERRILRRFCEEEAVRGCVDIAPQPQVVGHRPDVRDIDDGAEAEFALRAQAKTIDGRDFPLGSYPKTAEGASTPVCLA